MREFYVSIINIVARKFLDVEMFRKTAFCFSESAWNVKTISIKVEYIFANEKAKITSTPPHYCTSICENIMKTRVAWAMQQVETFKKLFQSLHVFMKSIKKDFLQIQADG